MSDERIEAAAIARGVRRYLERERAGGGAELLADGAARLQAEGPGTRGAAVRGSREPGTAERAAGEDGGGRADAVRAATLVPGPSAILLRDTPSIESIFDDESNPAGLAARAAIASAALPVLREIADEVCACTKCGLHSTRTRAVPGVGAASSGIVFVGEAPGADEDRKGEPFVGRAGQLLDRIIQAMDDAKLIPGVPLNRDTVFICNVLKSRPPENRNPLPHEVEACAPYLRRQLAALRPRIICCLGKFAAELLCGAKGSISGLRGKVYRYQGAKLIVTYHPAFLLRSPSYKRPVWEDMQMLAREYTSD
ncbi:MAG: uracil-DNA glycosylase [Candidatus Eisenbacteria bacterium]|uniref:Type-4 uracil-DNA glycosylase n=1 Tax=Eiseniibacteriota bacterium TaxID=2212470 RepID=A0A9D6L7E0_UNCEI|nr:uracil-DNA glycosylase [Candidatus Eisenbacteria bacterium]